MCARSVQMLCEKTMALPWPSPLSTIRRNISSCSVGGNLFWKPNIVSHSEQKSLSLSTREHPQTGQHIFEFAVGIFYPSALWWVLSTPFGPFIYQFHSRIDSLVCLSFANY